MDHNLLLHLRQHNHLQHRPRRRRHRPKPLLRRPQELRRPPHLRLTTRHRRHGPRHKVNGRVLPNFQPHNHVHGEHYLELTGKFPKEATLKTTAKIIDIVDKKAA